MPEPEPIATGNPAYDAVYERIRSLGDHLPPSPAHRNAMIWRAVEAALCAERAAAQRRLIAAFQTDPDPGADEAWTRGHRAGLTTAVDALHATATHAPAVQAAPEGDDHA